MYPSKRTTSLQLWLNKNKPYSAELGERTSNCHSMAWMKSGRIHFGNVLGESGDSFKLSLGQKQSQSVTSGLHFRGKKGRNIHTYKHMYTHREAVWALLPSRLSNNWTFWLICPQAVIYSFVRDPGGLCNGFYMVCIQRQHAGLT